MTATALSVCLLLALVARLAPSAAAPQQQDAASDVAPIDAGNDNTAAQGAVDDCQCVPYFLCDPNNTIIDNGQGLIDVRSSFPSCPGDIEVCCRTPLDTTPTSAPQPTPDPPGPTPNEDMPRPQPPGPSEPEYPEPIPTTPSASNGNVVVPQAGCGVKREQTTSLRVLMQGGQDDTATHFAEFPWMLAVLVEEVVSDGRRLNRFKCGASLITASVGLTAAHCISGLEPAKLKVRAGEWDTQSRDEALPHQDRGVTRVLVHPEFRKGPLYNDVALVFVDAPFTLTDNVDTVCLPSAGQLFQGRGCYATGWGRDSFGSSGAYQKILRKVELPMVANSECQSRLRRTRLGPFFKLHDSFVCAGGEEGRDTCQGDGGGPLVCPMPGDTGRYAQAGVVAWGIGCGESTNPAVYASVASAADWILDQTRNQDQEP